MGREIRRVPRGWQHPEKMYFRGTTGAMERGFIPLLDASYPQDAAEWMHDCVEWEQAHMSKKLEPGDSRWYWEEYGDPPDRKQYVPYDVHGELPCFQVYETVSEGTPVSPVFDTVDELRAWLIEQGNSAHAADCFIRDGSVPSMVMSGGKLATNLDIYDLARKE